MRFCKFYRPRIACCSASCEQAPSFGLLKGTQVKRIVMAAAAALLAGSMNAAHAQAMKNVDALVEGFGKTCMPPSINMETFGKELWQARSLILVDILVADGPDKSLMGLVFDTDGERFKATYPEFAHKADFPLKDGWSAVRSVEMTRFRNGNMNGSEIARPMLLCTATKK